MLMYLTVFTNHWFYYTVPPFITILNTCGFYIHYKSNMLMYLTVFNLLTIDFKTIYSTTI